MRNRNQHTRNVGHTRRVSPRQTCSDDWLNLLSKRNVVTIGECWVVDGKLNTYAQLADGGKRRQAHRLVYELLHGELSTEIVVHHRCFNPGCINPSHLQSMPNAEHVRLHRLLEAASTR